MKLITIQLTNTFKNMKQLRLTTKKPMGLLGIGNPEEDHQPLINSTVDEYKLPLGKYKCKNPNCKKKIHVTIFPSSESSLRVDILKKSKYDS